jgi:hypothetical protein
MNMKVKLEDHLKGELSAGLFSEAWKLYYCICISEL